MSTPPVYSITEMNRLRDRAYVEAQALRREAMQDFWRGADAWLQSATSRVERSAQRLASRMQHHSARPNAGRCGGD